jgi:hypothetical protein
MGNDQAPVVRREPEVFTRRYKIRTNLAALWMLVAFFVPLGIAIGIAAPLEAAGNRGLANTIAIAGAVVGFVAAHTVRIYTNVVRQARLRRELATSLERRLGRSPDNGSAYFVGWAPMPYQYRAGTSDHDVGFLTLGARVLAYVGDGISFELAHGRVLSVKGAQPSLVAYMDEQDAERLAVFNALGGDLPPLSDALRLWHETGMPMPPVHVSGRAAPPG